MGSTRRMRAAWAAVVAMGLVACGGADSGGSGAEDIVAGDAADTIPSSPDVGDVVDSSTEAPTIEVQFQPCELTLGQGDALAECATVSVPLDHDDPAGPRIEIAVKRYRVADGASKAIWFLPGGPGQSGTENLQSYAGVTAYVPGADIYTLDHRGSGASTRLSCSAAEAADSPSGEYIAREERESCAAELEAAWGEDLRHFNRSQAALDVAAIVAAIEDPDYDLRIVRGGSYGSAWARRVLALEPTAFDAALLSAVVVPSNGFGTLDAHMDATGRAFLAACSADPACSAAFGDDPVAAVSQLYSDLGAGYCAELGLDPTTLREVAGEFLSQPLLRSLLPPLYWRLMRCSADDIDAIERLFEAVFDGGGGGGGIDWPLFIHISASELTEADPPAASELLDALDFRLFATGRGADIVYMREGWPLYEDPHSGLPLEFEGPMLWMHGSRDPLLPVELVESTANAELTAEQTLVVMADAGHSLAGATPAVGGGDCGLTLEIDFFNAPGAEIHPCVDALAPMTFEPSAEVSEQVFGDANPWGGAP